MTSGNIVKARLQNQLLADKKASDPKAVVSHFGAIQAQDYAMSKWAVGIRTKNATDETVEKALDDGHIVRTHVLRPTWHLVAADDVHWMLELTASNIRRQMNAMNRSLKLDAAVFAKTNDIIAKALEGNRHLTREELMQILVRSGIRTDGLRSSHIMFAAELDRIVCNGIRKGKQNTYALLDEKVKNPKKLLREEALAELAKRYFQSHSPAAAEDYAWWSGLSLTDARIGIAMNDTLIQESVGTKIQYRFESDSTVAVLNHVGLLPAFDEFLISYKDRSASIHDDHSAHAFTKNGIFRPLIVERGKVVGIWKRVTGKKGIVIETSFFESQNCLSITAAVEKYSRFLNQPVVVNSASEIRPL
ncbi:MAG TPA: winged helix DNA-binding domain-containing protein [Flavobacterium sp.]|jgi:hypothetical protein